MVRQAWAVLAGGSGGRCQALSLVDVVNASNTLKVSPHLRYIPTYLNPTNNGDSAIGIVDTSLC